VDDTHASQEPELCFPTGDCLVYLREPGQSSRGPAFRVHTSQLIARGFTSLVDRCIIPPPLHASSKCHLASCPGCDRRSTPCELYLPAPPLADLEATIDHHTTTRNLFAWLYNRPLAGRALGLSLVALKERIESYRPTDVTQTKLEVLAYAESQRYLDFRECIDHALAALLLAEHVEVEDMWVDAFAHCVGLSHRGLQTSIEYAVSCSPCPGTYTTNLHTRHLVLRRRF